jgi:Uma2 family endonuclease
MSISLQPTTPAELEGDLIGHDYRLSEDQYREAVNAGIIPGTDEVELRDGFLTLKSGPNGQELGAHYRLGVSQYEAMAERGILTKDDRIELLEGWLIAKMSKNRPHTVAKGLTRNALMAITPADWFVTTEDPITAVDSQPEPDISIVRGSIGDYLDRAPGPQNVALVVEVADSSLARDRSSKKRLYARSGFAVYWIVNLVNRRIEVYTEPTGLVAKPDYACREDFGPDEMIPLVIEGREVGRLAVRDLLP